MIIRWLFGLPGAALMTGVLFIFMAGLIGQPPVINTPVDTPVIEFLAKPEPPEGPKPISKRPPTIEAPEPPIIQRAPTGEKPTGTEGMTIPGGKEGPIKQREPINIAGPTIKTPPPYPAACASRNAEGVVTVEFDVTERGEVVNAKIVSSANSCFNSTALRTVEKYRYSPKMVDGQPVAQRGLRENFRFELQDQ